MSNMAAAMSAIDWIVIVALLFTVVFVAAWALSAGLRTWIEKPKYRFLASVERHDREVGAERGE
jgi:hypothetical protein